MKKIYNVLIDSNGKPVFWNPLKSNDQTEQIRKVIFLLIRSSNTGEDIYGTFSYFDSEGNEIESIIVTDKSTWDALLKADEKYKTKHQS